MKFETKCLHKVFPGLFYSSTRMISTSSIYVNVALTLFFLSLKNKLRTQNFHIDSNVIEEINVVITFTENSLTSMIRNRFVILDGSTFRLYKAISLTCANTHIQDYTLQTQFHFGPFRIHISQHFHKVSVDNVRWCVVYL